MTVEGSPTRLILKIGGSLFSDKHRSGGLDEEALDRWAGVLADLAKAAPGRLVFVSGGGSDGHGIVRDLDRSDGFACLRLTEAMFGLKWRWTRALYRHGVRCMPLQLAAMASLGPEGVDVHSDLVRRLLGEGLLPVLTGDSLLGRDGSIEIFGSDRVPEALVESAGANPRVVMLTDVPGILADGPDGGRLLESVDPMAPEPALDAVRASASWDGTNSMAGKLEALLRVARQGAECFVIGGLPERSDLRFLLDPVAAWPSDERYTRIARQPLRPPAPTVS